MQAPTKKPELRVQKMPRSNVLPFKERNSPREQPEDVVRRPSTRLLERVMRAHAQYVDAGGKITIDQVNDSRIAPETIAELLMNVSFDTHLVKIGKGWNLQQLTTDAVRYSRTARPAKKEAAKAQTATEPVSAIPKKKRVRQERQLHIVMPPVPPMDQTEPAEEDTFIPLAHVRTVMQRKLIRHPDWIEKIQDVPEGSSQLDKLLKLLGASESKFLIELSKEVGSENLAKQCLSIFLDEQLKERYGSTPQSSGASTPRLVNRAPRNPVRAPAGKKQTA